MKKDMEKIDSLIKEALSQEEASFYDNLGEQNLFEKLGGVYKGKMGWLAILMNIVSIIILGLLIFFGIQFFDAQGTPELIKWGAYCFVCFMVMSMIKLYVWMQMDKNDVLREIKRLELQISALSHKPS